MQHSYETEIIALTIEHLSLQLLQITNIDALYDALIAKGSDHADVKDERIPYWAELWASALGLSTYLVQNKSISPNDEVLEIGAGLALPSIVAGKLGAKKVTITDYLPEAVDFAQQNWTLNLATSAEFDTLDWRSPDPKFRSDIILASDIAYEKRTFAYLIPAFEALCRPNGRIILSEPNRTLSQSFIEELLHCDKFQCKKSVIPVELRGRTQQINILEMTLC